MIDAIFNYSPSVMDSPNEGDKKFVLFAAGCLVLTVCLSLSYLFYMFYFSTMESKLLKIITAEESNQFFTFYSWQMFHLIPFTLSKAKKLFRFVDGAFCSLSIVVIVYSGCKFVEYSTVLDRKNAILYEIMFLLFSFCLIASRSYVCLIFRKRENLTNQNSKNILSLLKIEQYEYLRVNLANIIQVASILFEFCQLISFPLQDLFNNPYFDYTDDHAVYGILNFFQLGFLISDSAYITALRFRIAFYCILIISAAITSLALMDYFIKGRSDKIAVKIRRLVAFPIHYLIFILQLAFVPIAVTFLKVLGCVNDWQTPIFGTRSNTEQCYEFVAIAPKIYSSTALLGFAISFMLISFMISATERHHEHGYIRFSTSSIAITKQMSILFTLVYMLIRFNVYIRSFMGLFILASLIFYNLYFSSCFITIINTFRSTCFIAAFYVCLVVAIFAQPSTALLLVSLGKNVIHVLWGGCVVIFLVFFIIFFKEIKRSLRNKS